MVITDISTLLGQAARKWPDAPALSEPARDRHLSFLQLDQALSAFGQTLERLEVGEGARVALLADAGIDYLLADYGCMANGRVRVPLDPALSQVELLAQLRDAGTSLLLFCPQYAQVAAGLCDEGIHCQAPVNPVAPTPGVPAAVTGFAELYRRHHWCA